MDNEYRYNPNNGPLVGRLFEERLLLSIIDAYPTSKADDSEARKERERELRLQRAMQALFGETRKGRRRDPDQPALLWMAREHYRDRAQKNTQALNLWLGLSRNVEEVAIRSDRELAGAASCRFYGGKDVSERLRKKFARQRELLTLVECSADYIHETQETQLLDKIRELLARAGIASVANFPDGTIR